MLVGDLHTVDILLMTSQPGGLRGNLQNSIRAFFFSLASSACCIRAGRENQFKGAIYPAKLIRLIEKVVERLARVKDGFAAFGLKVYSVFWGGNTWFWFSTSFFLRQNSGEIYGL